VLELLVLNDHLKEIFQWKSYSDRQSNSSVIRAIS